MKETDTMTLTYATLTLDLPFVESKKGRRAILNTIKERLSKMNCSLLDISGEYPKEAEIALSFLALTEQDARQKLETIETALAAKFPDLHIALAFEFL